ncbi:MAG: [FeFe] hydrogenase H-cluster maturation GTPase HydF [Armatimonadetes bacterium]|nr:[FeFe] hydrogenase H-cluster maturation GTPase HydF [Armatimonadota bacterium]
MSTNLNQTPSSERVHISIFGRRNSGKSSLINALTNQRLAIVSDVPGTTTDPVSKSMEILPIGPVVVTDTAGIDDVGDLGKLRVEKTLRVLESTDLAVLIVESGQAPGEWEDDLISKIKERDIPLLICASKIDAAPDFSAIKKWATERSLLFVPVSAATREGIEELKQSLTQISPSGIGEPTIIGDLITGGDIVVLVVPIDKAAPKGRLILPQVMTIRDALDHDAIAITVKERELHACLDILSLSKGGRKPKLVITDSQAFLKVDADTPKDIWMTSFSILMARYKGDLAQFVAGAKAIDNLKIGDRVLISEGCTHHAQADDIGRVQIPRWLRQMVGGELEFGHSSGKDFPPDIASYDLIVHCGGCMINPREMLYRQRVASEAGIPMTNYGVLLAKVHGILDRALEPFPLAKLALEEPEERPRVRIERTTI